MNKVKNAINISVRLGSKIDKSKELWLSLPIKKACFIDAISEIERNSADIEIAEYTTNLQGLSGYGLMDKPFSMVNHLAKRLSELNKNEVFKLRAIMAADGMYWTYDLRKIIEYTYSHDCYTIFPEIRSYEDLAVFHIDSRSTLCFESKIEEFLDCYFKTLTIKGVVNLGKIGERIARKEQGKIGTLGYVKSSIHWNCDAKVYPIPQAYVITMESGEELYGRLPESYNNSEIESSCQTKDTSEFMEVWGW